MLVTSNRDIEQQSRLYRCNDCLRYESCERFVPTVCRCGGEVVECDRGVVNADVLHERVSFSPKQMEYIFNYYHGICHITGFPIDPLHDAWDVEHVIPIAVGGTNDIKNTRPALRWAHQELKTPQDRKDIAKVKRTIAKHNGFKRSRNPVPGSKASGWYKPMNGRAQRR